MEGPLEIKSSAPAADEPIKSEEAIRSPDNGERSDGAASPPPNCSICLGKLINTSFTDSCLHQFCFTCLLQWSKIKTECPLCKQTFKSIIHNVRSEEDYDQYHVPRELAPQNPQSPVVTMFDFDENRSQDIALSRDLDFNRSHQIIRQVIYRAMLRRSRRETPPSYQVQYDIRNPRIPREESRRRRENPEDYRRMVYRLGVYACPIPTVFGQFRERRADHFRRQPRELDRLIPWLNRELQVLLNNDAPHIAYVLRVILDALVQYDIRSPQFRDLVRPYFGVHTEHFVHELLVYARTDLSLAEYDQSVTYPHGLSNEYVSRVISPTSSSRSTSSDDSNIRVLGEAIDLRVNAELPSMGPHLIDMPGPSTVGQALQIELPNTPAPDVLTISSNTSSSDDECEIVGYVKPRHARTPELIELSSDSGEPNAWSAPRPCTSLWTNDAMQVLQVDQERNADSAASSTWHRTPSSQAVAKQSNARTSRDTSWIKTCSKTSDGSLSSESSDSDSDSDSIRRSERYRAKSTKKSSASGGARKRVNASKNRDREQGKRGIRRSRRTRKRSSSSSDSSYHESTIKQNESKSRRSRRLTRGARRIRDDSAEDQETRDRYAKKADKEEDSSSTTSTSDSDESSKSKRRTRKSTKYSSASSDTNESRVSGTSSDEKVSRSRSRNASKTGKGESSTSKENHEPKDDRRYARDANRSPSRSSSDEKSFYTARRETKSSGHIKRESPIDASEYGSHDEAASISKNLRDSKRRNYGSRARIESDSSSDSDRRDFDSSSRRSEKTHTRRRKSKRKGKYKEKEKSRKRSSGKNSDYEYSTSGSSTSSSSAKDSHRSSRRANYKNDSSHRDRHEASKKHRRRSQSDSNLRCKKRKRIRRSSSSSQ